MLYLSLTNEALHQKTVAAATTEKSATLALLEFLQEVDRRRLYAERGYPTLWMYVHRELQYSEVQTSERVGTMRLMVRVPEVRKSLEANELTLTTAAKFATFVKKEKPSQEKTHDLLKRIANQPKREVEKILFAEQAVPSARPDHVRQRGVETTRISFDADEEFVELLERLKELQADPTLSLQTLLKKTMKEYVAKRDLKMAKTKEAPRRTASSPDEVASHSLEKTKNPSRYISTQVKNFVRSRSNDQCEYIARVTDPNTQKTTLKRCESKSQLQFDHRMPFALGGTNEPENIRHLCKSHNLHAAEKIFGIEKMDEYLKRSA